MDDSMRVVITGVGAITPFGTGVRRFFEGLKNGESGTRKLSLFLDPLLEGQVAAEVPDFDPLSYIEKKDLKRVPRVVPMAIGASREALLSARIDLGSMSLDQKRKIGVVIGTGGGGIEFAERQYKEFFENKSRKVTPYCVSSSFVGMLSSEISIALDLHSISHVISTGCTSSTDAIGYAYQMIQSGRAEMLLTGGAEACITNGLMAGFCQMGVMSTHFNEAPQKASRPFDLDRDGFVLGEGAWMFVVESRKNALKRGAKIYAEITGYASTCDAYHRVAAKLDGVEPARALVMAMEEAGVRADQIQCVNVHGTATQMNDAVETQAVKLALGDHARRISLTAIKSMIGHPQGACGAAGVMSAVFSLQEQFVPPTINYETPDPKCDLDYTPNKGRVKEIENILCNTIAFGSKNSALLMRRADDI